jgi:hypothetical protein
MKSHQLFAAMAPAQAAEILEYTFTNDKQLYHAALEAVAQARKLRPVFLERQPRHERDITIASVLTRPALELAADSLLRTYLLKKHTLVLTDFLEALKIPHEKGTVENLPASVEDAVLQAAVDGLLAKHPPEIVALYLHAFTDMNDMRWLNLDALLAADARLKLRREGAESSETS